VGGGGVRGVRNVQVNYKNKARDEGALLIKCYSLSDKGTEQQFIAQETRREILP
jgi:hypothetical protein